MSKSKSGDFFVRSAKGASDRYFTESEHDASVRSSPDTDRKLLKKSTLISRDPRRDRRLLREESESFDKSENGSGDNEDYGTPERTRHAHSSSFMQKSSHSGRSLSRMSSHSERSRQSFSTEHDSDEMERERTFETIGNEDESVTESSATIQQVSPIKKRTSADLLAEESSQLLLSQGVTEGSFWNVLTYTKPKHKSKEEWEDWKKLIFYPSNAASMETMLDFLPVNYVTLIFQKIYLM